MSSQLVASLKYYGISPWELEVLYGLLNKMFHVEEHPDSEKDEDFTTMLDISIPLAFNEEFFKWFGNARWDKVKALLKELKRRRGGGRTLRTYIRFSGSPNINFVVDLLENSWFNTAIDKIDFVLELLPFQLDPRKIPQNIRDVIYEFDETTGKWNLHTTDSNDVTHVFSKNEWNLT
jgi:hypothetical protein